MNNETFSQEELPMTTHDASQKLHPRATSPLETAPSEPHDAYRPDLNMTSIVSYPRRCSLWGNARYRGNCDGRLFKDLVLRYGAKRIADPMMGSGTTRDVIAGLNRTGAHSIDYWGADLRTGFDLTTQDLPGLFDFIWVHPNRPELASARLN